MRIEKRMCLRVGPADDRAKPTSWIGLSVHGDLNGSEKVVSTPEKARLGELFPVPSKRSRGVGCFRRLGVNEPDAASRAVYPFRHILPIGARALVPGDVHAEHLARFWGRGRVR